MANSKQNTVKLNTDFFNSTTKFVILITSLAVVLLAMRRGNKELLYIYSVLMAFLLLNAYVVANFANVLDRLNSRAIWLIAAINMIMICNMLTKNKSVVINE